jgi:hypothetical protein
MRLKFRQRTICNPQVMKIVSPVVTAVSVRDVCRGRNGRPSNLIRQPIGLTFRKPRRNLLTFDNEIHGLHSSFKVTVTLHRLFHLLSSAPNTYLSFAPFGTSSLNVASTGRPSGPTVAATIIPFDSTPRSFRGWRFVTRTTFIPTTCSGL